MSAEVLRRTVSYDRRSPVSEMARMQTFEIEFIATSKCWNKISNYSLTKLVCRRHNLNFDCGQLELRLRRLRGYHR